VNGRPAAGIVVVFSVDCTLGAVIPSLTVTDAKGKFTSIFRSFVPVKKSGFKVASVTAALPSFPGTSTASVIAIVDTGNQKK
jgi:hypothetical protein